MANKTLGTRQKQMFRGASSGSGGTKVRVPPAGKPRNPFVVPALKRRAGAHRKDAAAQRQAERQELARRLGAQDAESGKDD